MKNKLLNQIQDKELKLLTVDRNIPEWEIFQSGDLLSVTMLSSTDNKRKTNFLGLCISKKNKGINSTFVIRNIIANEGIEFQIPYYSPLLKNLVIVNKKKTRASKLYYVRNYLNFKTTNHL